MGHDVKHKQDNHKKNIFPVWSWSPFEHYSQTIPDMVRIEQIKGEQNKRSNKPDWNPGECQRFAITFYIFHLKQ